MNFLNGSFLSVGDNPLADTREQTMNANMHLGLVSALILTICVPLLMDAVPGEETNGFMVTDPEWIGAVYFIAAVNSSWSLALATLYAIVVLLVMNECSSAEQGRYLVACAQDEILVPIKMAVWGWIFMIAMLILWLVITNFAFTSDCPNEGCKFPVSFGVALGIVQLSSAYCVRGGLRLIAKLYKSQKKFESTSRCQMKESWYAHPTAAEAEAHLDAYLDRGLEHAHPDAFKVFVIHQTAGAHGLSYYAHKLLERLFEERIQGMLDSDCKSPRPAERLQSDGKTIGHLEMSGSVRSTVSVGATPVV